MTKSFIAIPSHFIQSQFVRGSLSVMIGTNWQEVTLESSLNFSCLTLDQRKFKQSQRGCPLISQWILLNQ